MEFYNLKNLEDEFIVHHHLGLGDSIICNGLVNFLSNKYQKIHLPVKESNFEMLSYFYSENKKVYLFKVKNDTREDDIEKYSQFNNLDILRIGFNRIGKKPFNKAFYKQLKLPYRYSYKYFSLPKNKLHEEDLKEHLISFYKVNPNKYTLVHNEYQWPGGRYELKGVNKENVIYINKETDKYKNLFYYRKLIEDASDIHCINGSFLHLVERVSTKAKLYYHNLRKNNVHLKNYWNFIEYEN